MSTTTTSSAIFNGNSRYAQDFQTVIDRSVAIASLPITEANRQKTALSGQATALTGIETKFSGLDTALQNLDHAMGGSSYLTSISNPSVVSATAADGATDGTYSIEVTDIGAYATSMTSAAWSSAGPAAAYTLTVGAATYTITPADNQAATVAAQINATAGDKVRATVVNVGPADTPDYRISLQSTKLGSIGLQLTKGVTDLQTAQTAGRLARYIVNGSGITVNSDTRAVAIASGLTVHLLTSSPGAPVDITLTRSSAAVGDALSAFATAYNAALDAVDGQRGATTGPLSGDSIVSSLSQSLRGVATYLKSGSAVGGLKDVGLDLGKDGHLTFSQLAFSAADLTQSAAITGFLGTSATGGFLKWALDSVHSVTDAGVGTIKVAEQSVQDRIGSADRRIADQQVSVDALKAQLQDQMAAADALIATMEQQYNYLSAVFQSMQVSAQNR